MENRQTVLFLKGLPASGKSTYSRELVADKANWIRVNKDDIRAMLDSQWTPTLENLTVEIRNGIIRTALHKGLSVVIDDTNLNPIHEQQIRTIVNSFSEFVDVPVDFVVKTFDVSVEECIERDSKRPNPVGEVVIRSMAKRWLQTN